MNQCKWIKRMALWLLLLLGASLPAATQNKASVSDVIFSKGGIKYAITGYNPPEAKICGMLDNNGNVVQADLEDDGMLIIAPTVEYEGVEYTLTDVENITHQTDLKKLLISDGIRHVRNISLCPQLKELVIGRVESLEDIHDLTALESLEIDSEREFGPIIRDCFNNVGITRWVAKRSWEMQENCLLNCNRLESLDLTDFFKDFDYDGLESFTTLSQIGSNCPVLTELRLPDFCYGEISYIAEECGNLTTVYMPENAWPGTVLRHCVPSSPMLMEIYCPSTNPLDVQMRESFQYNIKGIYEPWVTGSIGGSAVDFQNCKVYVPAGAVETYKSHPSWSQFRNIVEYDFSALKEVESDNPSFGIRVEGSSIVSEGLEFEVFDIAGKRCPNQGLASGIYVIKNSNGATTKVVVR